MALLRSASTVASMTMISRVLGFVRDMLMASVVGTGLVADAFVVAFRFPNLFRRLFAEGAFNAAFVPLFARRLEGEGQPVAVRFAEEVLAALLTFLLVCQPLPCWPCPGLSMVWPRVCRYTRQAGPDQRTHPYCLSVSHLHVAGGVARRHSQLAASLHRRCRRPDCPQCGHDRCAGRRVAGRVGATARPVAVRWFGG
jgi:peptidoglycan biosynthesis protein MviN/MurJ (putative lipid II flippase)